MLGVVNDLRLELEKRPAGWTNIHWMRFLRGMTREAVAEAAGLSVSTYRRLEVGEVANPPIRYLVNLAVVFDCTLAEVVEDKYARWLATPIAPRPPEEPRALWARRRKRTEIPVPPASIWGTRTSALRPSALPRLKDKSNRGGKNA